jgi:hypothetical protein
VIAKDNLPLKLPLPRIGGLDAIADARNAGIKSEGNAKTTSSIESKTELFTNPELSLSFKNIANIFILPSLPSKVIVDLDQSNSARRNLLLMRAGGDRLRVLSLRECDRMALFQNNGGFTKECKLNISIKFS